MFLAPLRGVTIRTFRHTFAPLIKEAGFTEAITPFVPANRGFDPLKDRELKLPREDENSDLIRVTPQFIGKDPQALRESLLRIRDVGYTTADLNAGCPYPMIRGKGRGSGLLRNSDVLRSLMEVGCEVMGEGNFSVKTRLGIDRTDELLKLMPIINEFPLRFLTVHSRTAKQMYEGKCDNDALLKVEAVSKVKIIPNGDLSLLTSKGKEVMVGRSFIRALGERDDIGDWLDKYIEESKEELYGEKPVIGRIKELLSYWQNLPFWRQRWKVAKLSRTIQELRVW